MLPSCVNLLFQKVVANAKFPASLQFTFPSLASLTFATSTPAGKVIIWEFNAFSKGGLCGNFLVCFSLLEEKPQLVLL